jgi:membrane protease YdiL (CAAX protease family)
LGHSPWIGMRWTDENMSDQFAAMGLGLIASLPMLLVIFLAYLSPCGPLKSLREITRRQLLPLFEPLSIADKAAVSLSAGLGEELLFRGLLQSGLAALIGGQYGWWIGLIAASVAFGVCHWLNTTYAVLAACMGAYFGLLLLWTGNLWTPILAHAAYDFMALILLNWAERRTPEQAEVA